MSLVDIEKGLKKLKIPKSYQLDETTFIADTKKFIKSHVAILSVKPAKKRFIPYYNRLLKFYKQLKEESK
ncbi:MAG: hypothetical protein IMY67_11080 [Bacteroidetes bacterium]|nr:hypothetical protein [Bacteroidota bacterium]